MSLAPNGFLSLPVLLLLGSVLSSPTSGPPLPLDPALAAIAPAQCIWYGASSGVAPADPDNPNHTEQLYAEPEVRNFIDGLRDQLIASLQKTTQNDRGAQTFLAELPKLAGAFFHRPMAACLEDLKLTDDQLELRAGLVLHAGKRRAELESAISNLVDLSLEQGLPVGTIQSEGNTWHIMRMSMQTPEVRWGWHRDYFVLAIGDGTSEDIITRLDGGKSPAWLEALRTGDNIERESSLFHLNIAALLKQLKPQLEQEQAWIVLEKLGLSNLQSFDRRAGFDELGCTSHAKLSVDGQRRGLLAFIPDRPLSDNDLRLIPKNAMIAAAIRFDLSEAWKNVLRIGEEFDTRSVDRIEENIRMVEEKMGFHLEDDLLGALDDVWTAYLPAGDLMSAWVGSAFAVKVKDAPRLRVATDALVYDLRAKLPPDGPGLQISDEDFEGLKIYTARFVGQPIPISPSWCVADDWFFLGLNPQTVRSLISREKISSNDEPSIAAVRAVDDALASREAPAALLFVDSPTLTRAAYPFVQMGTQLLSSQLKPQGIDFDPSILPSSIAIVPHLRPFVGTMAATSDGPTFHSQHSLPGGSHATALLPLTMVVGGRISYQPATINSRQLNNMKQIALAFHNYADVNSKFPANIYDEDGNALLSWRVNLLPYLEQQALYEKFRLDEPWDSEHNLPLSKIVINTYTSLGGARDGRTCYLALAGEKTIFPGNEAIGFADVTDGTSNTVMFVQAIVDRAVPWSQPEDIEFDEDQPFQGLEHPSGRFPIAMNDGSCRFISQSIGEEAMQALATRNGKELLSREQLNR